MANTKVIDRYTHDSTITHNGDLKIDGSLIGQSAKAENLEITDGISFDASATAKENLQIKQKKAVMEPHGAVYSNSSAKAGANVSIEGSVHEDSSVEAKRGDVIIHGNLFDKSTAKAGQDLKIQDAYTGRGVGDIFNFSSAQAERDVEARGVRSRSSVKAGRDAKIDGEVWVSSVEAGRDAETRSVLNSSNIKAGNKAIINGIFDSSSVEAATVHIKSGISDAKIICQELNAHGTIQDSTIAEAQTTDNGIPSGVFTVYNVTNKIPGKEFKGQENVTVDINNAEQPATSGLDEDFIGKLKKYKQERAG
jgi:hypothetical protein